MPVDRWRTRHWLAALAVLGLTACASTGRQSAPTTRSSTAPSTSSTLPGTPTTVPGAGVDLEVFFLRTDKIAVARRHVPATAAVATAAMNELLAGPTTAERTAGLATTIPAGTRLLGLTISSGTATVDLTGVYASGGGSLSVIGRLAEVTYTLTQFPTVQGVVFHLDGKAVSVFSGEGLILDHPATRASFESVTPAIFVEGPAPGDRVASPIAVFGTANVFEAQFRLQLVASDGRMLADQAVHASSGTGTRGTFEASVPYPAKAGQATLVAFDLSPRDGSRENVIEIPLELTAG